MLKENSSGSVDSGRKPFIYIINYCLLPSKKSADTVTLFPNYVILRLWSYCL